MRCFAGHANVAHVKAWPDRGRRNGFGRVEPAAGQPPVDGRHILTGLHAIGHLFNRSFGGVSWICMGPAGTIGLGGARLADWNPRLFWSLPTGCPAAHGGPYGRITGECRQVFPQFPVGLIALLGPKARVAGDRDPGRAGGVRAPHRPCLEHGRTPVDEADL